MPTGIPFKYQTKPKAYTPVGMPKVKFPKMPEAKINTPKPPKQPRVKILDRVIQITIKTK